MVRTSTDRIAELETKIAAIKARDERKAARAKPETRHLLVALRGIDGALSASADAALRKPLDEARGLVSSTLALLGVTAKAGKVRTRVRARQKSPGKLDAESVLTYVRNNAGQKGEEIAAAFGTDTATLRPVLRTLIGDGKVRTEGARRGTKYVLA